jgi:hypothetical protein
MNYTTEYSVYPINNFLYEHPIVFTMMLMVMTMIMILSLILCHLIIGRGEKGEKEKRIDEVYIELTEFSSSSVTFQHFP